MSDRDVREEICPDCQAGPDNMDSRITSIHKDPDTDAFYTTITWHTDGCPAYAVEQILMEDGVRRAKEQSEWGQKAFPAAHKRLKAAAASVEGGEATGPFVAALLELVAAQGEDLGRVVLPEQWAEILDRHFPPDGE